MKDWLSAINSVDDIVCLIDTDYNIIDINKLGLDLLKKNRDEIIGQKCYKGLHSSYNPNDYCPLSACILSKKTEKTEIFEKQFEKHFYIKISPVFSNKGWLLRFILSCGISPHLKKKKMN